MVALRGALPLILTGSSGLALLGFGLTGLSGTAPELARAAKTVRLEKAAPVAPNRLVDCPPTHRDRSRGEV